MQTAPRRLPAPWQIVEHPESFEIRAGNGLALAHVYFEDEPSRRDMVKRLTSDEARRVAQAIARLPEFMGGHGSTTLRDPAG